MKIARREGRSIWSLPPTVAGLVDRPGQGTAAAPLPTALTRHTANLANLSTNSSLGQLGQVGHLDELAEDCPKAPAWHDNMPDVSAAYAAEAAKEAGDDEEPARALLAQARELYLGMSVSLTWDDD